MAEVAESGRKWQKVAEVWQSGRSVAEVADGQTAERGGFASVVVRYVKELQCVNRPLF